MAGFAGEGRAAEEAAEDKAQCVVCMDSDRAVLFLPGTRWRARGAGRDCGSARCAGGAVERAEPFFL